MVCHEVYKSLALWYEVLVKVKVKYDRDGYITCISRTKRGKSEVKFQTPPPPPPLVSFVFAHASSVSDLLPHQSVKLSTVCKASQCMWQYKVKQQRNDPTNMYSNDRKGGAQLPFASIIEIAMSAGQI